jgi:hypothetical protein
VDAVIGPQCPAETKASPCPDRPHAADIEIVHAGEVVKRVHVGRTGVFVVLNPGRYVVRAAGSQTAFPFLKPARVRVRPHDVTPVTLRFDSGIR